MKGILTLLLVASAVAGSAQSPFQDARGNSSFLIPSGGYAQIAFDKSSARFGFIHDTSGPYFLGFDLNAKLSGDSANLFSEGKLVNDVRLQLSAGKRLQQKLFDLTQREEDEKGNLLEEEERLTIERKELETRLEELLKPGSGASSSDIAALKGRVRDLDSQIDHLQDRRERLEDRIRDLGKTAYETLGIRLHGRAASYKLFDGQQPLASQFRDERFEGWGVNAVFNGLLPGMRYGMSIGFERDNNIDSLSLQDFTDTQTWVENGVTRTSQTKTSAYVGDYRTVDKAPLRADLVWWPAGLDHRVGLTVYGRYDLKASDSFRPGVGIFLSKPGAPTTVIGGLTVLFDHGKPQAALIAGYSF